MPKRTYTLNPESWGRILLIAAHPDDEVLGLGGHFRVTHPRIYHLTTGAFPYSPELRHVRHKELVGALRLGGIPSRHQFRGNVADQSASDHLPSLFADLRRVISQTAPDCLLVHPFEGGHPDHDCASLLARLLGDRFKLPIFEFTSYHNRTPFGLRGGWKTGSFLNNGEEPLCIYLSQKQRVLKKRMLNRFKSQAQVLQYFPDTVECFRRAPAYNFKEPPHPGKLLYEAFGWSSFAAWRSSIDLGLAGINR